MNDHPTISVVPYKTFLEARQRRQMLIAERPQKAAEIARDEAVVTPAEPGAIVTVPDNADSPQR